MQDRFQTFLIKCQNKHAKLNQQRDRHTLEKYIKLKKIIDFHRSVYEIWQINIFAYNFKNQELKNE